MPNINIQPLLDLLAKAGNETSEFKKAKTAGRIAQLLVALGAVVMVASAIAATFGQDSKIGLFAGALATCGGAIANAITSAGYSASRQGVKATAGDIVATALQTNAAVATPPDEPNQEHLVIK